MPKSKGKKNRSRMVSTPPPLQTATPPETPLPKSKTLRGFEELFGGIPEGYEDDEELQETSNWMGTLASWDEESDNEGEGQERGTMYWKKLAEERGLRCNQITKELTELKADGVELIRLQRIQDKERVAEINKLQAEIIELGKMKGEETDQLVRVVQHLETENQRLELRLALFGDSELVELKEALKQNQLIAEVNSRLVSRMKRIESSEEMREIQQKCMEKVGEKNKALESKNEELQSKLDSIQAQNKEL